MAFKFLKNPFIVDDNNIQNLSDIFNEKKTHLEYDIALIKEETYMPNETNEQLWNRLLSNSNFMVLKNILPKFVSMFGSTYLCESTFSSLLRRKSKIRSSLSQINLESELRCEMVKSKPDLSKLSLLKECHPSH
ncbi:hypothetical protein EON73_03630 [bacterium]|nr:MAG: hypothetical protein EON73_03630 [bacterium]